MAAKTFCPIMMIGFNAPEKGQRDLRLCTKDCMWYHIKQEKCVIPLIAETLENLEMITNDISDYAADALSYGGYIDEGDTFDPYKEEGYHTSRDF